MKHPVPTLAAIALIGAVAPATYGASIKDDTMSLTFKNNLQLRGTLPASASDDAGNDWDIFRNTAGESEPVRFDVRRARLGLEAKYGDWKGRLTIRAEKNDNNGSAQTVNAAGTTYTGNGRAVQLYYANIERGFKVGDGMDLAVRFGLDKSYNNDSVYSSSAFLFPSDSVVTERIEERNLGLGLMFKSPLVHVGVDIHNNSTGAWDVDASDDTTDADDGVDANGLFYSARIQFSPKAEWMPAKSMQSFTGKEGTHLVIGIDFQMDDTNVAAPPAGAAAGSDYSLTDTFTWGPDVLFHWNNLSAGAEYRMRSVEREDVDDPTNTRTAAADVDGTFWNLYVAYAFPLEDVVIEPALRFSEVDSNKDDADAAATRRPYTTGAAGAAIDNGGDGRTIDLGVNFYFSGHDNKLQIALQLWEAEFGNGDATIIRVQQQLNF